MSHPTRLTSRWPSPIHTVQCEQTAKGTGCEVKGVCGKTPETAFLQASSFLALPD